MILDILNYPFMQRALIGGFLIGISTALIGVFLVFKKLSLLGDSLAHISFGGIALGLLLNINPILTAIIFAVIASFGIDKLTNKLKLYGDSAIAVILSFGIAFALILIGISNKLNSSIFSYLFGSILTISNTDLIYSSLNLILISIFYFFNYKTLLYSTFNKDMAFVKNNKTIIIDKIFLILAAITIVIAIRAVGILLISALIVIPTLIGTRLSNSFKFTLILSCLFSVLGIYLGIFFSYLFNLPTGATIVMSLILLFVLSFIIKK